MPRISPKARQEDFLRYYEEVKKAYLRVYERLGLVAKVTEASGGNFSTKISYEYMVLTDAGEDDILYCPKCDYCINTEIAAADLSECPHCGAKLKKARAAEAGNIFDLGTHYSEIFKIHYLNAKNRRQLPHMGCYGIGISRCMGIIAEKYHDKHGLAWPASVTPAQVYLIGLKGQAKKTQKVYEDLKKMGISVIYDDRENLSAGAMFAASDLVGCPWRVVISDKTAEKFELKPRTQPEISLVTWDELCQTLTPSCQT